MNDALQVEISCPVWQRPERGLIPTLALHITN